MKSNRFILEDLTMVLEAIKVVRAKWIAKIEEKALEYVEWHPEYSLEAAKMEVITSQEVHEVHMSLIALYSCIGSGAEAYIKAIKGSEEQAKRHLFLERRSKERKGAA